MLKVAASTSRVNFYSPQQRICGSIMSSTMVGGCCSKSGSIRSNTNRYAHTVRVIVTNDVTTGKQLYTGDVATVAAGYARNYLIPQKLAVYATRDNFMKYQIDDPKLETLEQRTARLSREAQAGDDQDLKAADLLRFYLRNKVLKIWRNIDITNTTEYNAICPGMVDAKAVRRKLSKQLKIDFDEHERIHIYPESVHHAELITEAQIATIMDQFGDTSASDKCTTRIKHLGEYIARITLRGNYTIPLKFEVLKR